MIRLRSGRQSLAGAMAALLAAGLFASSFAAWAPVSPAPTELALTAPSEALQASAATRVSDPDRCDHHAIPIDPPGRAATGPRGDPLSASEFQQLACVILEGGHTRAPPGLLA